MKKYEIIVNNYVLGSNLKRCATDKIVEQTRIDRNHVKIVFANLTQSDLLMIKKAIPYCYNHMKIYED